MPGRTNQRYPPDYKARIVELARAGRSVPSLAEKFGPSDQTIRNWVRRADLDEGRRSDGLTTEARKEMMRLKRENDRLRMEGDILRDSRGLVRVGERIDPQQGYAFMKEKQGTYPLAAMCRVLDLSTSGYYDWLGREPSAQALRDVELKKRILTKWVESGGTYGAPRIHVALQAEGERVARKRVARLMRELEIRGSAARQSG